MNPAGYSTITAMQYPTVFHVHCRGVGYKSDFMTYCTNKLYGLMFARELAVRLRVRYLSHNSFTLNFVLLVARWQLVHMHELFLVCEHDVW